MTIKYSVVIPTRNRAEYLPYAIKSVLNSKRRDIELIISNNFSTDETEEILSKISDSRIKIISPNETLPMAGHYEFAISHAKGEWITILGDDDAVMPYIFDSIDNYISQYPGIDIISSVRAYYFWKGCEDVNGNAVVRYQSNFKSQLRSTKKDLMSVLKGLRICFNMPQIYTTCVVKRSLYEEIKINSGGCFYHSIIPDMYSVVALCLKRKKYLRVEEPLFWVGTSNKSLGRSDRIYKDAEKFKVNTPGIHTCVPKKISENVSYFLHSNAFSPYYIFECLLKSPLNKEIYEDKKIKNIVLAATLNISKKRKKSEQMSLKKEIYSECTRLGISLKNLYFTAWKLQAEKYFLFILDLPHRILKKTGLFDTWIIRSDNRHTYPTILTASDAVENLINKK